MPNEISREIDQNGKVKITYDDNTVEVVEIQKAPNNINVDAEHDSAIVGGHTFKND